VIGTVPTAARWIERGRSEPERAQLHAPVYHVPTTEFMREKMHEVAELAMRGEPSMEAAGPGLHQSVAADVAAWRASLESCGLRPTSEDLQARASSVASRGLSDDDTASVRWSEHAG
jgi:hypothetical protein